MFFPIYTYHFFFGHIRIANLTILVLRTIVKSDYLIQAL